MILEMELRFSWPNMLDECRYTELLSAWNQKLYATDRIQSNDVVITNTCRTRWTAGAVVVRVRTIDCSRRLLTTIKFANGHNKANIAVMQS